MRARCHIEREFSEYEVNFLWLEYHQVRFVSFVIWFIGLFLTDFTVLVSNPTDGHRDVIDYIRVISIIHITFVCLFLLYLIYFFFRSEMKPPCRRFSIQCLFDLTVHLDISALIFCAYFTPTRPASMAAAHCFCLVDIILTAFLTPYKLWRAAVDLFGLAPSLVVAHCYLALPDRSISPLFLTLPLSIILLCPLLFSVAATAFSKTVPGIARKLIELFDPSLLPNQIAFARQLQRLETVDDSSRAHPAPTIQATATSGGDGDYYDFKAVPFAIAATFLIHIGCFAAGTHTNSMVVMAHYFIMLAAVLINTRVVAFPSIVLTNVDPTVSLNTVWPELSFV
jgi:hypothetical protein